jgi:hypothetical protein
MGEHINETCGEGLDRIEIMAIQDHTTAFGGFCDENSHQFLSLFSRFSLVPPSPSFLVFLPSTSQLRLQGLDNSEGRASL